MTMITPSYLGETIEYSSLHACRSTLEDPTPRQSPRGFGRADRRALRPNGTLCRQRLRRSRCRLRMPSDRHRRAWAASPSATTGPRAGLACPNCRKGAGFGMDYSTAQGSIGNALAPMAWRSALFRAQRGYSMRQFQRCARHQSYDSHPGRRDADLLARDPAISSGLPIER